MENITQAWVIYVLNIDQLYSAVNPMKNLESDVMWYKYAI